MLYQAVQYPLYDELRKLSFDPNILPDVNINAICRRLNNLARTNSGEAKNIYEIIYSLIIHYSLVEMNQAINQEIPPLNGKCFEGGRGVTYSLKELQPLLQRIILIYLDRIMD